MQLRFIGFNYEKRCFPLLRALTSNEKFVPIERVSVVCDDPNPSSIERELCSENPWFWWSSSPQSHYKSTQSIPRERMRATWVERRSTNSNDCFRVMGTYVLRVCAIVQRWYCTGTDVGSTRQESIEQCHRRDTSTQRRKASQTCTWTVIILYPDQMPTTAELMPRPNADHSRVKLVTLALSLQS